MILRHTTHKSNLANIYAIGALNGEYYQRPGDVGHVSFELNPKNNMLTDNFHLLKKKGESDDYMYLEFDGDKLSHDGYDISSTINGVRMTKVEIKLVLTDLTDEQYKGIGEYRFIKGKIPLCYLTESSRICLEKYVKEHQ